MAISGYPLHKSRGLQTLATFPSPNSSRVLHLSTQKEVRLVRPPGSLTTSNWFGWSLQGRTKSYLSPSLGEDRTVSRYGDLGSLTRVNKRRGHKGEVFRVKGSLPSPYGQDALKMRGIVTVIPSCHHSRHCHGLLYLPPLNNKRKEVWNKIRVVREWDRGYEIGVMGWASSTSVIWALSRLVIRLGSRFYNTFCYFFICIDLLVDKVVRLLWICDGIEEV